VLFAGPSAGGDFYKGDCTKISIFMSVFDAHINRIPCEGKVRKIAYHPGKFFAANLDKASRENEHNAVFLETEAGEAITMVQIAGLIARRILCSVREGESVIRGQRMGMICFGSRMEVFLPPGAVLNVAVGHRVKAGTSILGYLK
jgi:phosphatidylserine decarboxylase